MIIFIASISVLVAYFVAKSVVGDVQNQSVTVKVIEPFSPTIDDPDPSIFNKDAINPTVEVIIGNNGATPQNQ